MLIAETAKWLAVNKPSGLNVEQLWDYPSVEGWAFAYLQKKTGREKPYVGLVHRLDRVTSGVVLLAKNKSTLRALNKQFAERTVRKIYLAAVEAPLPVDTKGTLEHYLYKDQANKRAVAYQRPKANCKKARLSYVCIASNSEVSLLRIYPETGRFHQIRVQLATIGWPIVGDEKYGASKQLAPEEGIMLHAESLEVKDPYSDEIMVIKAPLPKNMSKLGDKMAE